MKISTSKYHCSKCANEFNAREAKYESDTISLEAKLPGNPMGVNASILHLVCPKCNTIAGTISAFGLQAKQY